MTRGDPALSILVVNYNTRDLLLACVASIYRYPCVDPFEVVVVDNASADGSVAALRERYPDVVVVPSPRNLGFGEGNNRALEACRGSTLVLLNPDAEVFEGTLQGAVDAVRSDASIGLLGCRLVFADGRFQPSCNHFSTLHVMVVQRFQRIALATLPAPLGARLARLTGLEIMPVLGMERFFDEHRVQDVDSVIGAFMVIRRDVVTDALGGRLFDPAFRLYEEDTDLCLRVAAAGLRVVYVPTFTALHHGGGSVRDRSAFQAAAKAVAKQVLLRKHGYRLAAAVYRFSVALAGSLDWSIGVLTGQAAKRAVGRAKLRAAARPSFAWIFDAQGNVTPELAAKQRA